jgi:antitoxin component of MazEF toxin-antitoxin module
MLAMVQKIIQIGSSAGVTIPKKQLEELGLGVGDEVKVKIEPVTSVPADKLELVALTQKLIKRHQAALDNLSQR